MAQSLKITASYFLQLEKVFCGAEENTCKWPGRCSELGFGYMYILLLPGTAVTGIPQIVGEMLTAHLVVMCSFNTELERP